jgi:endonuclease/exonuclease/phosphatase family metal-dependent hydrolase
MVLRILSYNIHGLPWIQCPIEAILLWAYVKCRCDVLCLQEAFSRKLRQKLQILAPKYGFHIFFAPVEPRCLGKPLLGFFTPCGLCILVKKTITVLEGPRFIQFHTKGGLDGLVNKGVLSVGISYEGKSFHILNTHFQADFNEIPCCSLEYHEVRRSQEAQLYLIASAYEFPLICGDFNKNEFFFFEKFDSTNQVTFPLTGQHLDHLLVLKHLIHRFLFRKSTYFSDVEFSDHIPVMFEMTL